MQDPLAAYQQAFTCPFCRIKFSDVVKLIPDCGRFICGACYDELSESLDKSKRYKCDACADYHVMPVKGLAACQQFADLLRQPIEKPLSEQAKKLKLLIENVQDELAGLDGFDPRDHIDKHCVQLEYDVIQAAESAVKHVREIEQDLLKQVRSYRQRCEDALSSTQSQKRRTRDSDKLVSDEQVALAQEISEFSAKWNDYFKRLNALASDNELEAAIRQTGVFQSKIRGLEQDIANSALNNSPLHFNPSNSIHSKTVLGDLIELSVKVDQPKSQGIANLPSKILAGHYDFVHQAIFLPDGRLVSCSKDKTIRVWDAANGEELFSLNMPTGFVYAIAVLTNGLLATGLSDNTIKVWDLTKKKKVNTLRGHAGPIVSLKVLKNGNLISCSTDNFIKIWNPNEAENNHVRTILGHGNQGCMIPIGELANECFVTCSADSADTQKSVLKLWSPIDKEPLVDSLPTGLTGVRALHVLLNGQVAIGTVHGTIKILDLEDSANNSRIIEKAHDERVTSLLQLSNGNLVSAGIDELSSSSKYVSIKVWSFGDLSLLQHIKSNHSMKIVSLAISEDETMLASGSYDKTIKLWPIKLPVMRYQ